MISRTVLEYLRSAAVRISSLAFFLLICASSALAQSRTVAVTFDDLPVALTDHAADAGRINKAILASLRRHHVPAIGFVNGARVEAAGKNEGVALLRDWVRRGFDLGNHTFSHADLNQVTVSQFSDEVLSNEPYFLPLLVGRERMIRYLRFPYNHTGDTQAKHDAVAAFLAKQGYTVAPCTIENEDYLFASAYVEALAANDKSSVLKLRAAYLAYTATEIDYFAGMHQQIFGHEIPQVMLLHVNRLNGDVIDQVLDLFRARRYRFVSLTEAEADPAYNVPDTFVTSFGWMWAYRWAKELHVKVNGNLETEPPDWVKQYAAKASEPRNPTITPLN